MVSRSTLVQRVTASAKTLLPTSPLTLRRARAGTRATQIRTTDRTGVLEALVVVHRAVVVAALLVGVVEAGAVGVALQILQVV